jgi:superfamily II DNA or RNA helicase
MTDIKITKTDESFVTVWTSYGIEQEIKEFFTFEVPGAKFTPKFKARLWDGKISMFDSRSKRLPQGLVRYLVKFASDQGYKIEVDKNLVPEPVDAHEVKDFLDSLDIHTRGAPLVLRDYQEDAITTALKMKKCILLSPTSSGKSAIIYSLIRRFIDADLRCLIIVPTTGLVEQMFNDFKDYSSNNGFDVNANVHSLYSGKERFKGKSNVLLSTWQSIIKEGKDFFEQFDAVIGDEAHGCKGDSLTKILGALSKAQYKIGTTGTLTNDNAKVNKLQLEGLFGPVYTVITTKELMDAGQVVKLNPTAVILKYPDEIRKIAKALSYQDEMDFLVTYKERNEFIAKLALKAKGNTIILTNYVEKHVNPLYDMLKEMDTSGRPIMRIVGEIPVAERERIRKDLNNHDNAIVVCSFGTMSTGISIPSIENIIFGSPTKGKIRTLQSIGRGLRLKEGKSGCNLFDLADDMSWKSKPNHTLKHAFYRYQTYAEEKFEVKTVEVQL